MSRRLLGMLTRPRRTLGAVLAQPAWLGPWATLLLLWSACAAALLSTPVGQQALVDERVRMTEAVGGSVDEAAYEELQQRPPSWIYLVSGGRTLLSPPVTLLTTGLLLVTARANRRALGLSQALALAVHCSVVLVLGQLVATPLHYLRESLTSPLNLAAITALADEGTAGARFLGTLDVFGLWWALLVAIALAVVTGRSVGHYALRMSLAALALAAFVATVLVVIEA